MKPGKQMVLLGTAGNSTKLSYGVNVEVPPMEMRLQRRVEENESLWAPQSRTELHLKAQEWPLQNPEPSSGGADRQWRALLGVQ
jgi:hypothetical protein